MKKISIGSMSKNKPRKPVKKLKNTELAGAFGLSAKTIRNWRDGIPKKERMQLYSALKLYYYFLLPEDQGGINVEKIEDELEAIANKIVSFTHVEVVEESTILELAKRVDELKELVSDFGDKVKDAGS